MTHLIEFPIELQDGSKTTSIVEVEGPLPPGTIVDASSPEEVIIKANQTLRSAMEQVRPVVSTVMTALDEFNRPSEIELEFSIKLSATTGAFIASAASKASFAVTLKWKNSA